jgi:hypothetical protein
VLRGLAADPDRRYPTTRALLDELGRDPGLDRHRPWRLAATGLTAAGLVVAIATALRDTPDATAPGTDAPDPRRFQLGIGVAWASQWGGAVPPASWRDFDAASLDAVVRAGGTSTNLRFDWSQIEPVRGQRSWSYADHQISEAEKRGLEPFVYTGGSPAWVGRDRRARCTESFRSPPPHDDAGIAAFRDFFRALSKRYCDRVKYYEFWDQPNGCSWMSCGCGDQTPGQRRLYALWLDDWYQAMRDGCRSVVLAVGGLDCPWGPDPDHPAASCGGFVDELYANGAGDSFDAVALHARGYTADLEAVPSDSKALNWEAIRAVSASLQRHGDAGRRLWVGWELATASDALPAQLVGDALARLRGLPSVFEARYLAVTDLPGEGRAATGLVAIEGPPAKARLVPRAAWFAFRDRALGPDTTWHGPVNPGMEFQGQPPSEQDTTPIPFWAPNGAWEFHDRFPRAGDGVLGRRFGYYAAGTTERFLQALSESFQSGRRYCFRSAAQGGRDNTGVLPYQIGYVDRNGEPVMLGTRTIVVDAAWRETAGVCHEVAASGPEAGRPIVVGFGSVLDGGSGDIWFDNLRVTSVPL